MRIKDYGDKANQDVAERLVPMALSTILILQQLQLHSQPTHWQVWCEQREGWTAGDSAVEEVGGWERGGGGQVGPEINSHPVYHWSLQIIITKPA